LPNFVCIGPTPFLVTAKEKTAPSPKAVICLVSGAIDLLTVRSVFSTTRASNFTLFAISADVGGKIPRIIPIHLCLQEKTLGFFRAQSSRAPNGTLNGPRARKPSVCRLKLGNFRKPSSAWIFCFEQPKFCPRDFSVQRFYPSTAEKAVLDRLFGTKPRLLDILRNESSKTALSLHARLDICPAEKSVWVA
jgi:hypothetical protein